MKHKQFSFLLAVLMSMTASVASAHDFEVDGIYYNITSYSSPYMVAVTFKGGSYTTYSNEYTGRVTIPESVTYNGTTYSVTSISHCAFEGCTGLTSVTIGNNVTSIGGSAFYGCRCLTSITIPNSVTSIGSYAFEGCSVLTKVEFASIESLCRISFANYYDNPLSYAHHLYIDGTEVTDLVIPNSVTNIGEGTFYGCTGLTSVTIPNSVTSIGNYAFNNCSGLTSVTIPNSVTSIGNYAFYSCSGLTKVEFASIESLCRISFANYYDNPLSYAHHLYIDGTEVTDLVIPNSVTSIGNYTFYGCSGLTSVTIPNSVTSIGDYAFYKCTGLTSVTIGNSVTTIGSGAFHGTAWYDNQPDELVYAGKVAYDYKGTMPEGTNIVLEEGTQGIAGGAFSGCSGLTSVTIPNSVTSIGDGAFNGCKSLTSITIPNSVTSIGNQAFYNCSGLTSVTIPNSVTNIGDAAFYGCI